jgi:hypothetical protein
MVTKDLKQEYKDWKEIKEFLILVKTDLSPWIRKLGKFKI